MYVHFTYEEIWIENHQIKVSSIILAVRKLQIKITRWYYFTSESLKQKISTTSTADKNSEKLDHPHITDGVVNSVAMLKKFGSFL